MNKRLLLFSILFSLINFYFIYRSQNVAHGGEVIVLILPALWIVGFIMLFMFYRLNNTIIKGILNKIIFIFCTPIPTLLFIFSYFIWVTKFESQKTEKIYIKNGYTVKETNYPFRNRTEFRSNNESKTGEFLLDSVKLYDKNARKYKTDIYEGWERFLDLEKVNEN